MIVNRWLRIGMLAVAGAMVQLPVTRQAAAEPYSAEEMLSECQALLSTAKATADPDAIELDNTFSTGNCWGAFLSIQQLATVKSAGAKSPAFRVCVPEDTTLIQVIQIFDAYCRQHPERQAEPFTIVAFSALREAYRCKR
ncbi:MAG: Rap1a/Tai family immunity protein [Rhodomicrobium sp.]